MKKALVLLALVAFALPLAAQVFLDQPPYRLTYYANRNNPLGMDATIYVVNPGTQGTPLSPGHGTICADFYVFNSKQEMKECCHCPLTANALIQLSLINDLTNNPLTGFPAADAGVIKVVADARTNCNEEAPIPVSELLEWATHIQQPVTGTFTVTEDEFQPATLNVDELGFLGQACAFVKFLGSGKGVCTCGVN